MASIHTRRGMHVVQWREPSGRQRSRAFDSPRDAKRFRSKIEDELAEGKYHDRTAGAQTLAQYAAGWSRGGEPSTQARSAGRWENYILPGLGRIPLAALRHSDVQRFADDLTRAGLAAGTVSGVMHDLGGCLNAAVRDRVLPYSPLEGCACRRVSDACLCPGNLSG